MPATPLMLFPLGTVLYPGAWLPLHIFEDRYRRLVRDLLAQDDSTRQFGVVAIRSGREAGDNGFSALHDVGCTALLQRVEAYRDGRFDILAVGGTRFTLLEVDQRSDLLRGTVDLLPESTTSTPGLAARISRQFIEYRSAMRQVQNEPADPDEEPDDIPSDPLDLSFYVAEAMILDVTDKQQLLAAADLDARLNLELALLRREIAMVRQFSMRPAVELPRTPYSAN